MPHVMGVDKDLSDGAYRLYAVIERCAWKSGRTDVSQDALADALGVSPDTIQRRLNELLEVGLITSERRGRGMTNLLSLVPVDEVYESEVSDLPTARKRKKRVSKPAPLRHQNPQNGGFSRKERNEETLNTSSTSSSSVEVPQASSSSSSTQSEAIDERSLQSRTKDRILAKVSRQMLESVPQMEDDELWSLYARSTHADFQDQGEELREANISLAGSVADEIRRRTLS